LRKLLNLYKKDIFAHKAAKQTQKDEVISIELMATPLLQHSA